MHSCCRGIINLSLLPAAFLLCLVCTGACRAESAQPTLDFIYVNANIGEAAGGHSAIRLGSLVFHYQFFSENRFFLVRDSWHHFKTVYINLSNRSLKVASLPVSRQTLSRVKQHFTDLLLAQQRFRTQEAQLFEQLLLIQQLQKKATTLVLPCAGLFDGNSSGNAAMLKLQTQLENKLGKGALSRLQGTIRNQIALLLKTSQNERAASWGASLQDALLRQEFVRLVMQGSSLAPESVITLGDAHDLSSAERKLLIHYKDDLADSVIRLISTRRPGQAKSLFVQTARYMAVSRSLSHGKIFTLNPFTNYGAEQRVPEQQDLKRLCLLFASNAHAARNAFFKAENLQDLAWTQLEMAVGRYQAVKEAEKSRHLRIQSGIVLPCHNGQVPVAWLPNYPDLSSVKTRLTRSLNHLKKQIAARYSYDLVRKNCATEILHGLNTAFTDPASARDNLGGWLSTETGFVFIPAWLHHQVCSVLPVKQEVSLPSYRLHALDQQYLRENHVLVWLRESNIFSSTLYTPRTEDSTFLFFTDDQILLRPVLGTVNLAWGGLNTVLGLFLSPFDKGEVFVQGIRGMFYSVPELFFCNIRKGTFILTNSVTTSP